jgi:hypothetical protein
VVANIARHAAADTDGTGDSEPEELEIDQVRLGGRGFVGPLQLPWVTSRPLAYAPPSPSLAPPMHPTPRPQFQFVVDPSSKPHIANDLVSLHRKAAKDRRTKLAISYALSQSTKLSMYEKRVINMVLETKHLPEQLAATGEVRRRQRPARGRQAAQGEWGWSRGRPRAAGRRAQRLLDSVGTPAARRCPSHPRPSPSSSARCSSRWARAALDEAAAPVFRGQGSRRLEGGRSVAAFCAQ